VLYPDKCIIDILYGRFSCDDNTNNTTNTNNTNKSNDIRLNSGSTYTIVQNDLKNYIKHDFHATVYKLTKKDFVMNMKILFGEIPHIYTT